jgi:hypothetical protein
VEFEEFPGLSPRNPFGIPEGECHEDTKTRRKIKYKKA